MANRYWVGGTGTWDNTAGSKWSTTSGGAGGASVPVAGDNVFISSGNVTLGVNTPVLGSLTSFTGGTFNCSSYTLNINGIFISNTFNLNSGNVVSTGPTTIGGGTSNLGSGRIEVTSTPGGSGGLFTISSSTVTLNSGTSLLVLNVNDAGPFSFGTRSKTFNDVIINLGTGSISTTLNITGSPTFRMLMVVSKNSAAHTVNFDNGAQVRYSRLIMLGSSSTNRLKIRAGGFPGAFLDPINSSATIYGQFVDMADSSYEPPVSGVPAYIGSNSITSTTGWLLQDPPKTSTLVDPLTTAPGSNSNWTVAGTINTRTDGEGGGGYSGTSGASMTSTDTFDLIGSSLVFERPVAMPSSLYSSFGVGAPYDYFNEREVGLAASIGDVGGTTTDIAGASRYDNSNTEYPLFTYPITEPKFIRIEVAENGYFTIGFSNEGVSWTTVNDGFLNDTEKLLMRSTRIKGEWSGVSHVGSINMLPAKNTGNFLPFFLP